MSTVVLNGLFVGLVYGLLAVGLVVVYRTSRIVNFAYGETGMLATFAYFDLRLGTNTSTFTPTAALANSTTYTATISGATNTAGQTMTAPYSWTFTTVNSAPTVTSTLPTSNATAVATTATVQAVFSRAMDQTTLTSSSFTLSSISGNVTATVAYNAATNTATLTPNAALANNATYNGTHQPYQQMAMLPLV